MSIDWIPSSRRRLLAACALALAVGTAPTFLRTFINDDVTYVLIGQKLNAGGLLYRDAVDNKPPLIYATVAAALRVAGPRRFRPAAPGSGSASPTGRARS